MTEIQTDKDATNGGRKPYVQPKLVLHGKVETITHSSPGPGTSQPG